MATWSRRLLCTAVIAGLAGLGGAPARSSWGPPPADAEPAAETSAPRTAAAKKRAAAKKQAAAKKKRATAKKRAAAKKLAAAKKKRALAKKRAAAKRRLAARRRAADRTASVSSGSSGSTGRASNMPPGWAWPPSPEMTAEGEACTAALDALGIAWKPAGATPKIATPITLPAMELAGIKLVSTYRKGPHVLDCDLALGLANQLPALYEAGVRELHFSRIHDYTQVRVNGVEKNTLSRHALGLAIDLRAFVDAAGNKAVVLDDYPLGNAMLLQVEQLLTDSGAFRTVLTPRNDPQSHDDHFHLEIGVDYTRPPAAGKQPL